MKRGKFQSLIPKEADFMNKPKTDKRAEQSMNDFWKKASEILKKNPLDLKKK